jgi:hypothetical protein
MENAKETKTQAPILEISFGDVKIISNKDKEDEIVPMFIPDCCREGWDSCPHVLKKQRPTKKNIGL